jgi:hypothetical protein
MTHGKHVVCRGLGVTGAKGGPGGGRPPSDDKPEQSSEFGTASLGCPQIDRTSRR